MSKAEGAVAWAVAISNNPAHGYDQTNRWGPDYDCSSLVISAWESAGVAVREAGASYTGNMMGAFIACGFREVTAQVNLNTGIGLQAGDVLLCAAHTALVVTAGRIVAARINEIGQSVGGRTGDQTGKEICQHAYYNYPWDCVLRYREQPEVKPAPKKENFLKGLPTLSKGSIGWAVKSAQGVLIAHGYSCGPAASDGDFGYNTKNAVTRFQTDHGLNPDGVVGPQTWTVLLLGVRE